MKYTSRAQLLRDAADSMQMQEAVRLIPSCKVDGILITIIGVAFSDLSYDYEFPLAVVEGKPVFVGDKLYNLNSGNKFKAIERPRVGWSDVSYLSWNPPKPKTVMVELLVEDAEYWSTCYATNDRISAACLKALEE